MNDFENHFGSAGNPFSGSQNPDEQNDWADKQQKELERQRKALARQQALNKPASNAPGFTAAPTGLTPAMEPETPLPQIRPLKAEPAKTERAERAETALPDFTRHWDNPLDKLPSGHVNSHLANKYSGRTGPRDWAGRPFLPHEAEPMIEKWKKDLHDMSQDMRDVLFLTNYQNDPTFRERANRAIHEWNRVMPALNAGRAVSQENSGLANVPSAKPASSGAATTGSALTSGQTGHSLANSLQTTAHVNDPKNETYAPLFQWAADFISHALGENSRIHGRDTVGHSDESMGLAYRAAGKAVREAAQHNFVEPSAVNAQGKHPIGHSDQSMAELEKTGFGKMRHQAVADTHELTGEKQGFTFDRKTGSLEADSIGTGFKTIPVKAKIGAFSLAATIGRMLHDLFGGDPIALEKTEADTVRFQQELDALEPMTMDKIYVKGHPDETGKNLTRYLYQQLGNQIVMLPATYLLSKVEGIAAITGVSAAVLTSQINAGIIRAKGKGDPYTAVKYGVPLGLMALLNIPFKAPVSIQTPQELKAWLQSVMVDFGVGALQQEGVRNVTKHTNDENEKSPR